MPFPSRYSGASLPTGSTSPAVASFPRALPVNFSGQTVDGKPSNFTVGGWVRLTQPQPAEEASVFLAEGQFQLTTTSGILSASFVSGGSPVQADIGVTDTNWHYVAVLFAQDSSIEGQGGCQIFLDGAMVGIGVLTSTAPTTQTTCAIGVANSGIEFACWCVWAKALPLDLLTVPVLGDPAIGTDAAKGLVAAWDFASGRAVDQSPYHHPVQVASQTWHVPCMESGNPWPTEGQFATPDPADALNPGGAGPFTMMGWIYITSYTQENAWGLIEAVATEAQYIQIEADPPNSLHAAFTCGSAGTTAVSMDAPMAWTHLALTNDGTQYVAYVNGVAQSPIAGSPPNGPLVDPIYIASNFAGVPSILYVQGISIWTTALEAQDISNYMNGADPTGKAGCVAYFPLVEDAGNTVTGNSLTLNSSTFVEWDTPVDTAAAEPSPVEAAVAPEPGEIPLMTVADYKNLAAKHGVDVTTDPDLTAPVPEALAETVAWYETLLKGVPETTANWLRTEFRRNLQISYQLYEKGIRTGGFEVKAEGDDTVIYYHTEAGPQEVNRLVGITLSPMLKWALEIFCDVGGIVAAALGVLTTAAKVTKAAGLFDDLLPDLGIAAAAAEGSTTFKRAFSAIMKVLKVLWEWKALYTFFRQLVTGSWWSLVLTTLSLVAQVVAIIASGGAAIAVKVAEMAIAIAHLVYDLTQMPKTTATTVGTT